MLLKPSSIFIHHYRVHITMAMKFTYLHVLVYFVCTLHVVLYMYMYTAVCYACT
jgi:hypothetical protein